MTTYRAHMSKREREARSKLTKIVHDLGLLRGTIRDIERCCGSTDCKCIRGQKHPMTCLSQMKNGKSRSIYIAQKDKEKAIEWLNNYKQAKELLEIICDECIGRLKGKD